MHAPILNDSAIDRLARLGGDDLVRQMIELFLEHGPGRMAALVDGSGAGDAVRVERAAHTLKSTAGNLGAGRLQATAETVEALAADGSIDGELVARLQREYDESVVALRHRLGELNP